jgi:hypothetical protein
LTLKGEARKLEQSESPATGSHGVHWQTVTAHAVGLGVGLGRSREPPARRKLCDPAQHCQFEIADRVA